MRFKEISLQNQNWKWNEEYGNKNDSQKIVEQQSYPAPPDIIR